MPLVLHTALSKRSGVGDRCVCQLSFTLLSVCKKVVGTLNWRRLDVYVYKGTEIEKAFHRAHFCFVQVPARLDCKIVQS